MVRRPRYGTPGAGALAVQAIRKRSMSDILIIGGGFAGLSAAIVAADEIRSAGRDDRVTLVSNSDQITIRPRLYEKDPDTLRAPLRPSLAAAGVDFVLGVVEAIDTSVQSVSLADGSALGYDRLILATGSELPPLPVPGVAEHTHNIDTYIRRGCARRPSERGRQNPRCAGARHVRHRRRGHDGYRAGGGDAQPDRAAWRR